MFPAQLQSDKSWHPIGISAKSGSGTNYVTPPTPDLVSLRVHGGLLRYACRKTLPLIENHLPINVVTVQIQRAILQTSGAKEIATAIDLPVSVVNKIVDTYTRLATRREKAEAKCASKGDTALTAVCKREATTMASIRQCSPSWIKDNEILMRADEFLVRALHRQPSGNAQSIYNACIQMVIDSATCQEVRDEADFTQDDLNKVINLSVECNNTLRVQMTERVEAHRSTNGELPSSNTKGRVSTDQRYTVINSTDRTPHAKNAKTPSTPSENLSPLFVNSSTSTSATFSECGIKEEPLEPIDGCFTMDGRGTAESPMRPVVIPFSGVRRGRPPGQRTAYSYNAVRRAWCETGGNDAVFPPTLTHRNWRDTDTVLFPLEQNQERPLSAPVLSPFPRCQLPPPYTPPIYHHSATIKGPSLFPIAPPFQLPEFNPHQPLASPVEKNALSGASSFKDANRAASFLKATSLRTMEIKPGSAAPPPLRLKLTSPKRTPEAYARGIVRCSLLREKSRREWTQGRTRLRQYFKQLMSEHKCGTQATEPLLGAIEDVVADRIETKKAAFSHGVPEDGVRLWIRLALLKYRFEEAEFEPAPVRPAKENTEKKVDESEDAVPGPSTEKTSPEKESNNNGTRRWVQSGCLDSLVSELSVTSMVVDGCEIFMLADAGEDRSMTRALIRYTISYALRSKPIAIRLAAVSWLEDLLVDGCAVQRHNAIAQALIDVLSTRIVATRDFLSLAFPENVRKWKELLSAAAAEDDNGTEVKKRRVSARVKINEAQGKGSLKVHLERIFPADFRSSFIRFLRELKTREFPMPMRTVVSLVEQLYLLAPILHRPVERAEWQAWLEENLLSKYEDVYNHINKYDAFMR